MEIEYSYDRRGRETELSRSTDRQTGKIVMSVMALINNLSVLLECAVLLNDGKDNKKEKTSREIR